MEGKDALIKKILDDASDKSNKILSVAEADAEKIIAEAEDWAKNYMETRRAVMIKDAEDLVERRLTVAKLDARKISLSKKRALIDEAFETACDKMRSFGKTYYGKFAEKLLTENADEGDTVILSRDGVLNADDVSKMKIFAEKRLNLSEKRGDFIGGVFLTNDSYDKDLSFASVVAENKEDLIGKIAIILFGE